MKKYLLTMALVGTFAAGFSGAVSAADLPVKAPSPVYKAQPAPAYNWTGFYVGGNVGAAWTQNDWYDTFSHTDISKDRATGFAGGLQIGYDWQFAPAWVVGIRGMFDWTSARTDVGQDVQCTNCNLVDHAKLKSFQTLTGRLGYLAQPNLMIYAKGGVAWAQDRYSQTEGAPLWQASSTRTGYDVGGGFEWMFAPNWSAFVEYDYANFGNVTYDTDTKITQNLQTVLIGVNYRFGGR